MARFITGEMYSDPDLANRLSIAGDPGMYDVDDIDILKASEFFWIFDDPEIDGEVFAEKLLAKLKAQILEYKKKLIIVVEPNVMFQIDPMDERYNGYLAIMGVKEVE